mmetsp:Transcript_73131/g.169595  ORF Transcript_73131/g.169595 Transcript_73131/m.169595 type:complete len:209 (-) Transcript_73131:3-629(-)
MHMPILHHAEPGLIQLVTVAAGLVLTPIHGGDDLAVVPFPAVLHGVPVTTNPDGVVRPACTQAAHTNLRRDCRAQLVHEKRRLGLREPLRAAAGITRSFRPIEANERERVAGSSTWRPAEIICWRSGRRFLLGIIPSELHRNPAPGTSSGGCGVIGEAAVLCYLRAWLHGDGQGQQEHDPDCHPQLHAEGHLQACALRGWGSGLSQTA